MKTVLLGTTNENKIAELRINLESLSIIIQTPKDLGIDFDPPETGSTFVQNALSKAIAWSNKTALPVLVEDSGLSVDSLHDLPGVHSKRFFPGTDLDKNQYILKLMKDIPEDKRQAHYTCAMVFYDSTTQEKIVIEEYCHGSIADKVYGNNGFGYDPIFIPNGFTQTFGELPQKIKFSISHRAKALAKLLPFLQQWSKG